MSLKKNTKGGNGEWTSYINYALYKIAFIEKACRHSWYLWNASAKCCIVTICSIAWIILAPSSMMTCTRTAPPSTVACVTKAGPSNWRLGTDVSKYKQNGLVWNAQSHKCQFSIRQCLPNTHTFPLNSVCEKGTCMFPYTGREIAWLASWHTKSPTSHTKISLWSGNYRSSHLTLLSPSSSPFFLIFWLQIEGDRQYKNPSIWLLTEKKLKMYSGPSALWLMNNVGWLGNCIDSRAGWYRVGLTNGD